MNIPDATSIAAYEVAKRVYEGSLTREAALTTLTTAHSMNRNSATDHLGNFARMVEGRCYTRTSNSFATDYFLMHIHKDYGADGLRNALTAVSLHLDYYEVVGKTTMKKIRSIQAKHAALLDYDGLTVYPEEVPGTEPLTEGTITKVTVNVYERNPIARQKCIEQWGVACCVCGFDFEAEYGALGRSFIHVHHLIELSSIKTEYTVDPINDLRPLCPNCHAMIQKKKPALSIDTLRGRLLQSRGKVASSKSLG